MCRWHYTPPSPEILPLTVTLAVLFLNLSCGEEHTTILPRPIDTDSTPESASDTGIEVDTELPQDANTEMREYAEIFSFYVVEPHLAGPA